MEHSMNADVDGYVTQLPAEGLKMETLMEELKRYQGLAKVNWSDGTISGTVYSGDPELTHLMEKVYGMFAWTNPLHSDVFPDIRKMDKSKNQLKPPENKPKSLSSSSSEGDIVNNLLLRDKDGISATDKDESVKKASSTDCLSPDSGVEETSPKSPQEPFKSSIGSSALLLSSLSPVLPRGHNYYSHSLSSLNANSILAGNVPVRPGRSNVVRNTGVSYTPLNSFSQSVPNLRDSQKRQTSAPPCFRQSLPETSFMEEEAESTGARIMSASFEGIPRTDTDSETELNKKSLQIGIKSKEGPSKISTNPAVSRTKTGPKLQSSKPARDSQRPPKGPSGIVMGKAAINQTEVDLGLQQARAKLDHHRTQRNQLKLQVQLMKHAKRKRHLHQESLLLISKERRKDNSVIMNSYLPLLLALVAVPLYAAPAAPMNMTYYMENVGSVHGKCGRQWTLPIDGKYQYELVSHGRAVNGDCTTTIVVGHSSKCTRKICVRMDEWTLDADIMNVTFNGEAEKKVLKFGSEKMTETCFAGIRLEIRVMEDSMYAEKWAKEEVPNNVYSFKFAVFPDCPGYPQGLVEASDKDSADFNSAAELEAATTMNIVYGVIVALLLASVFLVVLLITYCYYKNNPQGRKRRSQKTSKLEETFNKEKKVMGEQVAKDKRVEGHYKKTDNSELQPLVSAAAPAAAAVVTQDDHGSPTIKISEDTDDKEEKGEE